MGHSPHTLWASPTHLTKHLNTLWSLTDHRCPVGSPVSTLQPADLGKGRGYGICPVASKMMLLAAPYNVAIAVLVSQALGHDRCCRQEHRSWQG